MGLYLRSVSSVSVPLKIVMQSVAQPHKCLALVLASTLSLSTFQLAQASTNPDEALQKIGDDYIAYLFKTEPPRATSAGVHTYDNELGDYSAQSVAEDIKSKKEYLDRLKSVDFQALSVNSKIDWNLLVGDISSSLLDNEVRQFWKMDPDLYSSVATRGVFSLIQRDFAPLESRLKCVIEREKRIPSVLQDGKKNLDPAVVPPIYNDIALEQLPGMIEFFEKTLPGTFDRVKDEALLREFGDNNAKVVAALKDYQAFVKTALKDKSKGTFVLGEDHFVKKLKCDELIEEQLDDILAKGEKELKRLQGEFRRVAKELDPKVDAVTAFESISSDHPTGDKLLDATRGVLEDIRKYCVEKPICTIPSEERARIDETPSFNRALSFASMDTPGPFEKKAREAFYYVTLPEKNWDAKRIEEHLRSYSYGDLINTSVHEAYPGHYVQFLWVNSAPTTVRKLFGCMSNDEGWAHYCEQMMLDEGYRDGDSKLRLVQIHDALLRNCRYIVGIKMHTRGMTVDEGIKFFMDEGFQEKSNAERETKRGTADPTYLVYTYGKLQILALRKEVEAKDGKNYSIRAFHDDFLKEGYPPVSLVRAKMLQLPIKKYF